MYIAAIAEEGLIGMDFLYENDFVFAAEGGLQLNGYFVDVLFEGTLPQTHKLAVVENTLIPANAECVVRCIGDTQLLSAMDMMDTYFIAESIPGKTIHEEIHIGSSLVDIARVDIGIPIRVMNTSNENYLLHKGTILASLQEVSDIVQIADQEKYGDCRIASLKTKLADDKDDEANKYPMPEWTQGVQDLFVRSKDGLSDAHADRMGNLIDKHIGIFAKSPTDLGRTSLVTHKIDTGDAHPIKQAPRRPPLAFRDEEEKIIADQLDAGVIRESTSPWSSPLVYVRKRDGSTRPCVDYRKLNDVTKKDAYPLPRIDDCLDSLSSAKLFSTLDLQSGYWQIEVDEADKCKTAFITRRGLYEYNTLPFGLCSAPASFERCMEMVFRGLQWRTLLVYLDDVVIFSSTLEEHISRLDDVFGRLKAAGLKLKPSKCDLLREEVLFLGHVVTKDGVKPDPRKVECIKEWRVPRDLHGLRSFVGYCSYYRRYIKGFSMIAAPLHRLTEAGVKYEWTIECQEAFDKLRDVLCGEEVMAYPKDEGLFVLDTDASNTSIGGVLSQMQWCEKTQREAERPISYASKSLTKTQRRYCVTRRELLAVVFFAEHFKHYLLGRMFIVRTDHCALRWLMSFREPANQMARWIEMLAQFDFKILHRAGKVHRNADGLSRIPCDPEECLCYDGHTILEDLPCAGCDQCRKKHQEWSSFFE